MFDIGGWEFLVIMVIAVIVIGPKDIPGTIRTITGWIRRARELARDFQSGLDDLAREAELDDVKNRVRSDMGIDEVRDAGNSIRQEIEHSIDPGREIENSFRDDGTALAADDPLSDLYHEEDEDPEAATVPRKETAASDPGTATPPGETAPDDERPEPAAGEPADAAKKA